VPSKIKDTRYDATYHLSWCQTIRFCRNRLSLLIDKSELTTNNPSQAVSTTLDSFMAALFYTLGFANAGCAHICAGVESNVSTATGLGGIVSIYVAGDILYSMMISPFNVSFQTFHIPTSVSL
jgi:hypothetical protein